MCTYYVLVLFESQTLTYMNLDLDTRSFSKYVLFIMIIMYVSLLVLYRKTAIR